jgi:hypothetical protein
LIRNATRDKKKKKKKKERKKADANIRVIAIKR